MTQNLCIIFDIDGTLADVEHRTHWVRSNPKNWAAFDAAMVHDQPYHDIIWMLKVFKDSGATILIASGRSDKMKSHTVEWLDNVAGLAGYYSRLYMRKEADKRPDNIVKAEILSQMRMDGFDPTIAIDDRNQVVNMWREQGLRCLQVAPGDF